MINPWQSRIASFIRFSADKSVFSAFIHGLSVLISLVWYLFMQTTNIVCSLPPMHIYEFHTIASSHSQKRQQLSQSKLVRVDQAYDLGSHLGSVAEHSCLSFFPMAKDVIRLRIQLEQSRCIHALRLESSEGGQVLSKRLCG